MSPAAARAAFVKASALTSSSTTIARSRRIDGNFEYALERRHAAGANAVELQREHDGRAFLVDALRELGMQRAEPAHGAVAAQDSRRAARAQRRMPAPASKSKLVARAREPQHAPRRRL